MRMEERPKMSRDDAEYSTHESYVKVGLCRTMYGGRGARLFGSPISHHNTIYLRVVRCEYKRRLAHDGYHGTGEELLEIELSPEQFATMITTMDKLEELQGRKAPELVALNDGDELELAP